MSHHTWNYQAELRAQGYRVTPQRELLLDLICSSPERLTAQELVQAARARSPALNPATVYRNLAFLGERKLIRAVTSAGVTRYALGGPHAAHHHLVCSICGDEAEIPERTTDDVFARIEAHYGFVVESEHLTLRGRCARCHRLATEEAPPRP